jgi:hypothetical protein
MFRTHNVLCCMYFEIIQTVNYMHINNYSTIYVLTNINHATPAYLC